MQSSNTREEATLYNQLSQPDKIASRQECHTSTLTNTPDKATKPDKANQPDKAIQPDKAMETDETEKLLAATTTQRSW